MEKKYYYLFGIEACDTLESEGVDALMKMIEEEDFTDYDTRCHSQNDNPTELLRTASGWCDYSVLTEEEYNRITKI